MSDIDLRFIEREIIVPLEEPYISTQTVRVLQWRKKTPKVGNALGAGFEWSEWTDVPFVVEGRPPMTYTDLRDAIEAPLVSGGR